MRVQFVTPTELKGAARPEFPILFARLRDRISTLRALYGAGPLDIDFRAMGERAAQIRLSRCDLNWHSTERRSSRTGQTHPLGGFTGPNIKRSTMAIWANSCRTCAPASGPVSAARPFGEKEKYVSSFALSRQDLHAPAG